MTSQALRLPLDVEGSTAEWLESALRHTGHDVEIGNCEVVDVIRGTATEVLLSIDYANGRSGGVPSRLCAKGGFDERMRAYALVAGFHDEARFYRDLAPLLDLPLPRCWFAGSDEDAEQAIVILDDLAAVGCTFGEPKETWPVDQVALGLGLLARLHGPTWGWKAGQLPWLKVGASTVRTVGVGLMQEPRWTTHFARPDTPSLPAELDSSDALAAAGGPQIAWADAWHDYGRHQLHGLMWAVNDDTMQPMERTRPMTDRFVAAALDHDVLGTLGWRS